MPLAAIGTDKRVCTASDELSNERIVKIPDTLINEIEIDFMTGAESPLQAVRNYVQAVKDKSYPAPEHCF